jgi:hypothetical protein
MAEKRAKGMRFCLHLAYIERETMFASEQGFHGERAS